MKQKVLQVKKKFNWNRGDVYVISETGCNMSVVEADFETAIAATGFGKFNFLLLLIAVPSSWTAVLATTTMSYVLPTAHCDLNLTLQNGGLLNAITYAGMISSACVWGFLADTLGRKKLSVYGYFLNGCFMLLAGASQSFVMLLFAMYMVGFIINGPSAALTSIISEFHSAKYRAQILMFMGVINTTANLILPLVAWPILTTNFQFEGKFQLHSWNLFIMVCAVPSLLSSLAHAFLPESPKFLMTMGRNEQALDVFSRVYSCNTGKPHNTFPVKSLLNEIELHVAGSHGGNVTANRTKRQAMKEGWQQIAPLFFPPFLAKLVLVCTIQLGFMAGSNTLRLWLPQIFTAINDYKQIYPNNTAGLCTMLEIIAPQKNATEENCFVNPISDSVYTNASTVAAFGILGYFFAGLFINNLGKKTVLIILGVVSGICGMSIYFSQNEWTTIVLSSLMVAFSSVNSNVMLSVIVDLFPTTLRTMTVAMAMMVGRIGTMSGNLLFPYLLATGCMPPFFVLGSGIVGCGLLSIVLPKTDLKALE